MMKIFQCFVAGLLAGWLVACSSSGGGTGEPAPSAATVTKAPPSATPSPPETATVAPEPTPVPPADTPAAADAESSGNLDLNFAQIEFVQATQTGDGLWRFDVTVRHNDQGWDHYADLWQVLDPNGNLLGERVLLHPHDTEQPFTRSQSGIAIPPEMTQVVVRAKCNVHGFGGQEVTVDLTVAEGENFTVVAQD
jgi:hypothetical protein